MAVLESHWIPLQKNSFPVGNSLNLLLWGKPDTAPPP